MFVVKFKMRKFYGNVSSFRPILVGSNIIRKLEPPKSIHNIRLCINKQLLTGQVLTVASAEYLVWLLQFGSRKYNELHWQISYDDLGNEKEQWCWDLGGWSSSPIVMLSLGIT